jgi:hypothetical protein
LGPVKSITYNINIKLIMKYEMVWNSFGYSQFRIITV